MFLVKKNKGMLQIYFSQDGSWIRIYNILGPWVWIRIRKLADPRIRIQVANKQPKCTKNRSFTDEQLLKPSKSLINIQLLECALFLHM